MHASAPPITQSAARRFGTADACSCTTPRSTPAHPAKLTSSPPMESASDASA